MVSSDSLTETFTSLVFLWFPPNLTQIEHVNKVLYHLPNTISLKTGLSAGRHHLHLSFLWKKERNFLVTWPK